MPVIGLVDCNNYFASCEKLFDPTLEGKPIVVLSNNDFRLICALGYKIHCVYKACFARDDHLGTQRI